VIDLFLHLRTKSSANYVTIILLTALAGEFELVLALTFGHIGGIANLQKFGDFVLC